MYYWSTLFCVQRQDSQDSDDLLATLNEDPARLLNAYMTWEKNRWILQYKYACDASQPIYVYTYIYKYIDMAKTPHTNTELNRILSYHRVVFYSATTTIVWVRELQNVFVYITRKNRTLAWIFIPILAWRACVILNEDAACGLYVYNMPITRAAHPLFCKNEGINSTLSSNLYCVTIFDVVRWQTPSATHRLQIKFVCEIQSMRKL